MSLSYQPVAQRMTVVVLKARHLPKMDITGLSGRSYFLQPCTCGEKINPQVHLQGFSLVSAEGFGCLHIFPQILPEGDGSPRVLHHSPAEGCANQPQSFLLGAPVGLCRQGFVEAAALCAGSRTAWIHGIHGIHGLRPKV